MVLSQPRRRDNAVLFAIRFMLSSAFLGFSIRWLTTVRAFSWEIWRLLGFFIACGAITLLIAGPRNFKWMGDLHPFLLRLSLRIVHAFLWMLGTAAIVVPFDSRGNDDWVLRGAAMAAVVICAWASMQLADRYGR